MTNRKIQFSYSRNYQESNWMKNESILMSQHKTRINIHLHTF